MTIILMDIIIQHHNVPLALLIIITMIMATKMKMVEIMMNR